MTRFDNYFCVGECGFKCFQNIVINLNLNSPITKKKTFIIIYTGSKLYPAIVNKGNQQKKSQIRKIFWQYI